MRSIFVCTINKASAVAEVREAQGQMFLELRAPFLSVATAGRFGGRRAPSPTSPTSLCSRRTPRNGISDEV